LINRTSGSVEKLGLEADLFAVNIPCCAKERCRRFTADDRSAANGVVFYGVVHRDIKPENIMLAKEGTDHSWREKAGGGGAITWRGIHWWPAADAHVSADAHAEIADVFKESARSAAR
jgi:serine/threonine protein kinase